jgi:hypothetical protein
MEISQENSLCSYLYLKEARIPCFSFSLFFFYRIGQWEGGTTPAQEGGLEPVEGGK